MIDFKFKIVLDGLRITEQERRAVESDNQKGMFEANLSSALTSLYPSGLSSVNQRKHARILDTLDRAEGDSLLLENGDFELLEEAFCKESQAFPAVNTRIIVQYQNNIISAKRL